MKLIIKITFVIILFNLTEIYSITFADYMRQRDNTLTLCRNNWLDLSHQDLEDVNGIENVQILGYGSIHNVPQLNIDLSGNRLTSFPSGLNLLHNLLETRINDNPFISVNHNGSNSLPNLVNITSSYGQHQAPEWFDFDHDPER